MPETALNAYEMDVEEKRAALLKAQAELDTAKNRLSERKKELGIKEPAKPKETRGPKEVTRSAEDGQFVSKEEAKKNPKTTVTEKVKG